MWKRLVRKGVRAGLRNRRLRALVVSELAITPASPPATESPGVGEFIDRYGVAHGLDFGLRDRLKPAWRTMLDPEAASRPPTDEAMIRRRGSAATNVSEASALLAAVAGVPLAGQLLEIGCYDGAVAFELAARPGTLVVASDVVRYYVVQRPGEPRSEDNGPQQVALDKLRDRARVLAGAGPGLVSFVEDDVTASALPPESFDAIVSFEVLEHVQDPTSAFAAMHRLLKPGGVAYHDYNPFFSLIGGHSLCTLDFPWGHARLDPADFERYVGQLRPHAADQTMRFYEQSLNRMTLENLRTAVSGAGLELLAMVPWFDRALVERLASGPLAEVQRNYPSATVEDLLATFVAVVVRRPP